jgi:phosphoserine phosphatase RsbU/P
MNTTAPALELHELEKLRENDLEEARAIQGAMLPTEALRTEHVAISHEFQPVTEVGGDFLDYFELTDGTFGLYLGDVSGKGLPATLYAALAVGTLRGVHKTGQAPTHVMTTLNRRLMIRGVPRRHAALQYAVFHPDQRVMNISSAGMPGPFHITPHGCTPMELSGIPPGLFPTSSYEMTAVTLEPGDSMMFCTDGITDAMDSDGESFGIDRVVAICGAKSAAKPGEILRTLFSAVEKFSRGTQQHDDMAAALFHYRE